MLRLASRKVDDGAARLRFGLGRLLRGGRLKVAERLLIAPQELVAGDPGAAMDIYSGLITLAGRTVQTRGLSPFRVDAPSHAWLHELHGFGWLRHFRDADAPVIRHHARALVSEWLSLREAHHHPCARLTDVAARRMMAWLINSPLLLTDADHAFYTRFMRALARTAADLEHAAGRRRLGLARTRAAIAYACYTLCAHTGEHDWKRAGKLLDAALAETVLDDGCPVDRNPRTALALAAALLPLRTAYTARGRVPPAMLQSTIDRLMAFLRLMRHPSGEIAQFNGMGATMLDLSMALMQFDDAREDIQTTARYGGYHRLERGRSTVIVDVGNPPPPWLSEEAHASALAFEFSAGRERIVVNCGATPAGLADLSQAVRETAAHSTLDIGGASTGAFLPLTARDGAPCRLLLNRDAGQPAVREDSPQGERLTGETTGCLASFGVIHRRQLLLNPDGTRLSGVDTAISGAGQASGDPPLLLLRFHLHPRLQASPSADGTAIDLHLSDGTLWTFEASGLPVHLEESVFFGGLSSQRRTVQIVVTIPAVDQPVGWAFTCHS